MLLSRTLYSHSIFPDLFSSLISNSKFAILLDALLAFEDISAPSLVEALIAFLNADGVKVVNAVKSKLSNQEISPEEARTCAINVIISKPFTSQLLRTSLKRLSDLQTVAMMNYLLQWWKLYESHTEIMLHQNRPKYIRIPPFRAIVQWSSLLIDSHLVTLIVNSEASDAITELNVLIQRHIALATNLCGLKGAIDFVSGKRVDHSENKDYEIAWLKFADRGQFVATGHESAQGEDVLTT
jgi:hypothetical protein